MATDLLWIGAEDLDFLPINGAFGGSTSGDWSSIYVSGSVFHNIVPYRTGYGRCAVCPDQTSYIASPNLGALTTLWFSARVAVASLGAGGQSNDFVRICDGSGVVRLVLNNNYGDNIGKPTLLSVTAAGVRTVLASASNGFSPPNSSIDRIDCEIIYGTAGTFNLWINGVPTIQFSGDLVTDANASVSTVQFGKFGVSSYNNNILVAWSEAFASAADTRTIAGVLTVPPAGDGATAQWSGSYADVDQILYVDTSTVSTTAANQIEQFTTATAPPAGNFAVDSVWVSVRAQAGTTAPQHLETGLHVAGADYFGASVALGGAMSLVQQSWADNPNTAAAWAQTDIASGVIGISLESLA